MNCHRCKKHPVAKRSTSRCEKCLAYAAAHQAKKIATPEGRAKRNEAVRESRGHQPWQPGKVGRPPKGADYTPMTLEERQAKLRESRGHKPWQPGSRGALPKKFRNLPRLSEVRAAIHKSKQRLKCLKKKNYDTAFEELRLATFIAQRNAILTSA